MSNSQHTGKHRGNLAKAIILVVVVLLLFGAVFYGAKLLEERRFGFLEAAASRPVQYNGKTYLPNDNIVAFLLIGVDSVGEMQSSGYFRNDSLADYICLLAFDTSQGSCTVIHINRDTMTDITVLGMNDREVGKEKAQIALSYSYGDGGESSCKNTKKAVSELLGDLNIPYYLSMTMDAVSILNDAVGGVEVLVEDDFSSVDPSLIMGQKITLQGNQALTFIRSRKDVGEMTNLSRMKRQVEYMRNFYQSFKQSVLNNPDFLIDSFRDISPYIVTNCSDRALAYISKKIGSSELKEMVSLPGEAVQGDVYMEYHLDQDQLQELILRIFYKEK